MTESSSPSSLNALRIDRSAPATRARRPWGWMIAGGSIEMMNERIGAGLPAVFGTPT